MIFRNENIFLKFTFCILIIQIYNLCLNMQIPDFEFKIIIKMKRNRIYKDRRNQGNLKKNAICYIKRIRDIPERGGIIFLFESFYKARDLGKENVRKKENRNKNSVYHDFLAQKFARDLEFSLFSVFIWFPRRELLRQPVFADFFPVLFLSDRSGDPGLPC